MFNDIKIDKNNKRFGGKGDNSCRIFFIFDSFLFVAKTIKLKDVCTCICNNLYMANT